MRLLSTDRGIAREAGDAAELLDLPYPDLGALLRDTADGISVAREAAIRERVERRSLRVFAPVPAPGKVVVIGMNFRSHLREVSDGLKLAKPLEAGDPLYYLTPGSAVVGPDDAIVLPSLAPDRVDYEGELAVVMGRRATHVPADEAWSCVAGLTVCNDVSARDMQTRAMREATLDIAVAKSFDTFKPLGPALVTRDEFELPLDLAMQTRVIGKLVQNDRTSDAIHSIPELIAFVSARTSLLPGDVICTGSPAGVGMWRGGVWLRAGDEVSITIERVGTLTNAVAAVGA